MYNRAKSPGFSECTGEGKTKKPAEKAKGVGQRGTLIEIENSQYRRLEKRREAGNFERDRKKTARSEIKRKRQRLSPVKKMAICAAIVGAGILFGFNGYKNFELNLEKDRAVRLYEEKLAEKERLELELSMVNDPEYIEQQAREVFHMVKDGEKLYVAEPETKDNSQ